MDGGVQQVNLRWRILWHVLPFAALIFSPWLYVTFKQMQLRMKYDRGSASDLAGAKELMDYCRECFSVVETPIDADMFPFDGNL